MLSSENFLPSPSFFLRRERVRVRVDRIGHSTSSPLSPAILSLWVGMVGDLSSPPDKRGRGE